MTTGERGPVRIVADDTGHLVAWRGADRLADVDRADGEDVATLTADAGTATVRAVDLHLLTRLLEHVGNTNDQQKETP